MDKLPGVACRLHRPLGRHLAALNALNASDVVDVGLSLTTCVSADATATSRLATRVSDPAPADFQRRSQSSCSCSYNTSSSSLECTASPTSTGCGTRNGRSRNPWQFSSLHASDSSSRLSSLNHPHSLSPPSLAPSAFLPSPHRVSGQPSPASPTAASTTTRHSFPSRASFPAAAAAATSVRGLHSSSPGGISQDGRQGGGAASGPPPPPPPPPPLRPTRGAVPRDEGLGVPMEVFDRRLKALHRDRSAALLDGGDPLLAAVGERLLDRLEDCRRGFPTAAVLGGAALSVVQQLAGGRAGIQRVVLVDPSQDMLDRIRREEAASRSQPGGRPWPALLYVRGEEEHLPLAPGSVDLIISCLGLHWANDLPGAMAQCRAALKPDGLFLAALLGGDTLQELRISCALAQMERQGGVSAVVSPLAQVRDAGNLLTRADLRLPSVDVDRFTLGYPSPLELVQHLRALGEGNAAMQRRKALNRDSALAAAAVYQSMFGGEGGSVSATYEVIFMTGWSPSASQPKAAKRGSATVSFQELADGLVQGGKAVGGTAEGEVLTPPATPPPRPPA